MISGNINVIEIHWEGPFTIEHVKKTYIDSATDYGLYQIYGNHNISGSNTLLYIGKASEQQIGIRIAQHDSWTLHEQSELEIFIGRFGGTEKITEQEWTKYIDDAERLLIYYSSPPYNSQGINHIGETKKTIVLNHGRKNRLPFEVSTLLLESEFVDRSKWKLYKYDSSQH